MFAEEHVVEESVEAVEASAERVAALADRTVSVDDGRVDEVKTVDAGDPWPARRVVTWAPENLGTGMKEWESLAEDDVLGGGRATVLCGGGGMNDM